MIAYKVANRGHIGPAEMRMVKSWLFKKAHTKDGLMYVDTSVRVCSLTQIQQIRFELKEMLGKGESWYVDTVGTVHEITLVPAS